MALVCKRPLPTGLTRTGEHSRWSRDKRHAIALGSKVAGPKDNSLGGQDPRPTRSSSSTTMANDTPTKTVGGEYGEIRANIDVDKLNVYLSKHVKSVQAPVEVKQFKVSLVHMKSTSR